MQTFTGGCVCGGVRYTINAEPIFSGKCYCNTCRRLSGSGHSAVFGVPSDTVSITGLLVEYTRLGGSEEPVTRRFCPTCGARISGSVAIMPGITLVAASSLDNPDQFMSQMNVYTAEAVPWDRPPVDAPSFPGMPPHA